MSKYAGTVTSNSLSLSHQHHPRPNGAAEGEGGDSEVRDVTVVRTGRRARAGLDRTVCGEHVRREFGAGRALASVVPADGDVHRRNTGRMRKPSATFAPATLYTPLGRV